MGGAQGVGAELFEHLEAVDIGVFGDGNAEGAGVFVEGDAAEFEIFAVEPEAGVGLDRKSTRLNSSH